MRVPLRPSPRPRRARSKKDRLYHALRREILTLALAPGRLLVEGEVARRFRTSKTPVREALACLEQDGLVETLPRRGYLVTPVTIRDVHELFEVRAALEGAAAELAASRITGAELAALDRLMAGRPAPEAGGADVRRGLDRNQQFHLIIARASRNERLARLIERTLGEMTRLIALGYETGQHAGIMEALRSGDGPQARSAVRDHILLTQDRVLKRESAGFPGGATGR